jgi:rare lipoprotein A
MKSFVLSAVLLLGLGAVASGPASAAVSNDARDAARRDRAATYRDSDTHTQRVRVARAQIIETARDFDWSEGKSYQSEQRSTRRTAKSSGRKTYAKKSSKKTYAKRQTIKRVVTRPAQRKTAVVRTPRNTQRNEGGLLGAVLQGVASFYWQPQKVAAGGWFNPNAMTAAHKTLPFGTRVRVTHMGNGRSVDVKINDRGPYIPGRIIDLSKAAAGVIGMQGQGVAKVKVTVLGRN